MCTGQPEEALKWDEVLRLEACRGLTGAAWGWEQEGMRHLFVRKEFWGAAFRDVPKANDPLLCMDLGLNIPCTSSITIN